MKIFALRDNETKEFNPPFPHANEQIAVRHTSASLRKGGTLLSDFPKAYALYLLGEVNIKSGKITIPKKPQLIVQLSKLVEVLDKGAK